MCRKIIFSLGEIDREIEFLDDFTNLSVDDCIQNITCEVDRSILPVVKYFKSIFLRWIKVDKRFMWRFISQLFRLNFAAESTSYRGMKIVFLLIYSTVKSFVVNAPRAYQCECKCEPNEACFIFQEKISLEFSTARLSLRVGGKKKVIKIYRKSIYQFIRQHMRQPINGNHHVNSWMLGKTNGKFLPAQIDWTIRFTFLCARRRK